MALGEFELIERFFAAHAAGRSDVVLGVGDDAAIAKVPSGQELIVAADTIVSGVHFPADLSPELIGYRALAVNLSDMAAMGAVPAWFTLALTLPSSGAEWLQSFSRGLLDLATQHRTALIGGDTTSGPLTISVQILGLAPAGSAIRRSGARVGDAVYVSGSLGDAAAGLAVLQNRLSVADMHDRDFLLQRFSRPAPRVALGLALRGVASAAIDVSDGLHADLGKLAAASGVGARLDMEALPLSASLARAAGRDAAHYALTGGDDYELCFTVPVERIPALQRLAGTAGVPELRRIGTLERAAGVRLYADGGLVEVGHGGFDHFRT